MVGAASAGPVELVRRISGVVASNTYAMDILTAKGAVELRQDDVPIGDSAATDKGSSISNPSDQEAVRYEYHVTWRVSYEVTVSKPVLNDGEKQNYSNGCILKHNSIFARSIKPNFGGRPFGLHRLGAQRLLSKAGIDLEAVYSLNAPESEGAQNEAESGSCFSMLDAAEEKAANIEAGLRSLSVILMSFENLGLKSRIRDSFSDAEVSLGPVVPSTEISIHGGNVDQVLLATYRALHSLGSLGKRKIRAHDIGISLADHLYRTRVLFSRYPALFDEFLADFDKRNKLRTITIRNSKIARLLENQNSEREAIRGLVKTAYEERAEYGARSDRAVSMFANVDVLKQILYRSRGEIIVPDLHIRISETAVPVEVSSKTTLGRRVRVIGLYRTVDERTGRHIAFSQNWVKVRTTLKANDFLVEKLDIPKDWEDATAFKVNETNEEKKKRIEMRKEIGRKVSDFRGGTISFPADVVNLTLPNSVLARPPRTVEISVLQAFLDKENVFSVEGARDQKNETNIAIRSVPAIKLEEQAKLLKMANQNAGENSKCTTDHHAEHLLPHLKAIGIDADNHKEFKRAVGWVAVIDKFAIPKDITEQHERDREFDKLARTDRGKIYQVAKVASKTLKVPIDEVFKGVERIEADGFAEFYKLGDFHDEFKDKPSIDPPIIAMAAEHKFIEEDHGFHVSSVIGGKCNNYGIVGVAPKVTLHAYNGLDKNIDSQKALKDYFRYSGRCTTPCLVNASFSIKNESNLTNLIVKVLEEPSYVNGVLLIAAAGQGWVKGGGGAKGTEICKDRADPKTWRAPACLGDHPNVLTVTSAQLPVTAGSPYQLQSDANFGTDTVWLAAPGINVLGATANPLHYSSQHGTSVAAAFVTGVSAVLKHQAIEKSIELSPCQLKARLAYTADLNVGLEDKVKFGWLNAARAIDYFDRDVVIMNSGSDADRLRVGRLGFINREGYSKARKIPDTLYLYEDDKDYDDEQAESIHLSDIRRISQQSGGRYTIVYADSSAVPDKVPCGNLKIRRDVRFSPKGKGIKYLHENRIYHSFGIVTAKGEKTTNIHEIKEVIVRASMD